MLRIKDACDALLHVVGWEQSYDPKSQISDALTTSESGMMFQQVHPLLTLDNLKSVAPQFNVKTEPYSAEKNYGVGECVVYRGWMYKATQGGLNKQPDVEPNYWVVYNPFSSWLEGKTRASITKMLNRFCDTKVVSGTMKSLCENKVMFDGTGRISDSIKNTKSLVGFELSPARSLGVTVKINRIGLQFTKPGTYKLYLMQSGSGMAVREIELTKTQPNSMEWFPVNDLYLPYMSDQTDAGGSWYLCYSQNEIPEGSEAIRKNYDFAKGPCSTCSRQQYISWKAWSRYLEVHPFAVSEDLIKGMGFNEDFNDDFERKHLEMWDVENNIYRYDTNYGLNLEVTVGCDITDFIIAQRLSFANLIGKQLAVDILREFAYNPSERINKSSLSVMRREILYELDGDSSSLKKSGLAYELDLAYKAMELSTQGMSRICLPCDSKGIRYRTV